MKKDKTIGHIEACKLLHMHKDRLHSLCVNGVGPAREKVLIKTGVRGNYNPQWRYKLIDILTYEPVWMCRNCRKAVPKNTTFCSPECRESCRLKRKKREKSNTYSTRFTPGMDKRPYEVVCPVCDVHHTIYADVQPDKFVYCPEHKGRRTWTTEDSIGRFTGCLI